MALQQQRQSDLTVIAELRGRYTRSLLTHADQNARLLVRLEERGLDLRSEERIDQVCRIMFEFIYYADCWVFCTDIYA